MKPEEKRILAGLACFALALAACQGPAAPAAQPQAEVRDTAYAMLIRRGPGWPAKGAIIGGEWLYDTPTGAGWLAAPLPSPRVEGTTRRYRLEHLELAIMPGGCADPEWRAAYPDAVTVTGPSGEHDHAGCGGPRGAVERIEGSHWQVLRLGSRPAPGGMPTIFTFGEGGGVGGTLACNDMGIGTRWSGGRFVQAGGDEWIEGTLVGCEGPEAAFGQAFWSAMYRARSWHRHGDRLRIIFADGSDAELRLIL